MRLKFENWLEDNNFPENAKNLFADAVTCYKANANAPALLVSYIGMLFILKIRLLNSSMPAGFPLQKWKDLVRDVKNDDIWEVTVVDAVKKQGDASNPRTGGPIFMTNENLRNQFQYWRDRRNDCAHYRDNEITSAHVESFWAFLQSNLHKITVEGGVNTLLHKFSVFYDRTQTPPGQDVSSLINEIFTAVERNELFYFWTEVFKIINPDVYSFDNSRENHFITRVLTLDKPSLSESLITYLKTDETLLRAYLITNPEIIARLAYSKQEIRKFWQTKMLGFPDPLKIYASLLRNHLIPSDQIGESNSLVAYAVTKYTDEVVDHIVLSNAGFGEMLYERLFVNVNINAFQLWKTINDQSAIITQYMAFYPINDVIVTFICKLIGDPFYPMFLVESLDLLFSENNTKKIEFQRKVTETGLEIPDRLNTF